MSVLLVQTQVQRTEDAIRVLEELVAREGVNERLVCVRYLLPLGQAMKNGQFFHQPSQIVSILLHNEV